MKDPSDKKNTFNEYEDAEGNSHIQIAQWDFQEKADAELVENWEAPSPEHKESLIKYLEDAYNLYNSGAYDSALIIIKWAMKQIPMLKPYLSYHVRTCQRILESVIDLGELQDQCQYEKKLLGRMHRPKWLSVIVDGWVLPKDGRRCRWCGCQFCVLTVCPRCDAVDAFPDWDEDSPYGRAFRYCYDQMDERSYQEFEKDFNI